MAKRLPMTKRNNMVSKCAVQRPSAHVRVCVFSVDRNSFAIVIRVSHRNVISSRSSMCGRALWARAACSRTLDVGLHLLKFRDTCSMVRCSEVAGSARLTRSRWSFCDAAASEMAVEQAIPSSRVPHSRGDEACNKNEYVPSVTTGLLRNKDLITNIVSYVMRVQYCRPF